MKRDEVCTCAQYSQCPVCNKSRNNYAELMEENERLGWALEGIVKRLTANGDAKPLLFGAIMEAKLALGEQEVTL